jgi:hypothetical protein
VAYLPAVSVANLPAVPVANLPLVLLIPVANMPPPVLLTPKVISEAWGKMIHEKNLKQKIL